MRYSRIQAQQQTVQEPRRGGGWMFLCAAAILAVGIYGIGTAKVSGFVQEYIIGPVVALFAGQEDAPAVQSTMAEAETFTWQMTGAEVYALQAGAYDSAENAENFAAQLRQKGGAGYVYAEDGLHRVYIAAYMDRADAENVKNRLENEQQMQTGIAVVTVPQVQMTLEADTRTAAELQQIASDAGTYLSELMTMALQFDKGEETLQTAKAQLDTMGQRVQTMEDMLREMGTDTTPAAQLAQYYNTVKEVLQQIAAAQEQAAFSADIKYGYLDTAFAYKRLAESIG